MHALLLWTALVCGTTTVPDGTLLFLDNSNLFVELYTGSDTTHVAVVVNKEGRPWVYEATPHEVRKLPLADYYAQLARLNQRRSDARKIRVTMVQPRGAYTPQQSQAICSFLDQQLQRRYSIKGYVRGSSDGIHCAELASRTLCTAGAIDIARCQDESPASLLSRVRPLSRPPTVVALVEPEEKTDWCTRSWQDWSAFGGWCQWSCWEAWTFCW